jgi:hypothetical protein
MLKTKLEPCQKFGGESRDQEMFANAVLLGIFNFNNLTVKFAVQMEPKFPVKYCFT